ncbi:cyclic nucleotide-gated ion channel 1 [Quercus suber]|uniref:cyclic nucleotide-gated ion channel 1 n=1 Tax=Quercus suber TaxID=58331 RepID=UPI0032DF9F61
MIEGGDSLERSSSSPLEQHHRIFQTWRIIFGVSCVIAVSLDPLFFYVPVINEENKCIELDKKLRTISLILRSVTDIIGIINIILQVLNRYTDKNSGEDSDPKKIPRWWLYFLIDILVLLPFPQVIILIIFRELKGSKSLNMRKLLTFLVLFQYVPRVVQIYRSWKDPNKVSNKTPIWVKAAFNFFLYIIASHVLGAFWYFLSIERETACWHRACSAHKECSESSFNCDHSSGNYSFLNDVCIITISPPNTTPNTTYFDFGIFFGALQSGVVQSKSFPEKFSQCFWWGLRNLSSLGQNLQTSNYVWESLFTILISLFGLLLFSYFIGNLQLYMQLETARTEEERKKAEEERKKAEVKMKVKREKMNEAKRPIEIWMLKHRFPRQMKIDIMQSVINSLERKQDVNVKNLLHHLPEELRNKAKRFLYLDLLKKLPVLENINEQLLLKICDSLKPVYYNEKSYIVREGDPIDETVFITDGIAWSYTTKNDEANVSSLAERLGKGHFFGGELLEFVLKNPSLPKLPVSPRTVKTHGPIEAFTLKAEELKKIVCKNWMCVGEGQSEPFAANVVQAAWRRYHESKKF